MKLHFFVHERGRTVLNGKILGGRPPPLPPLRRGPCCITSVLSILFIIFAIYTYGYIFLKHLNSRRRYSGTSTPSELSVWQAFRMSKFFISALLVGSYLILRVVPVLVLVTMTFVHGSTLPNWLIIYSSVSVALSDLMDGLIYVILCPSVQKQLRHSKVVFSQRNDEVKIMLNKAYMKGKEYVQSPLLTLKQRATTLS